MFLPLVLLWCHSRWIVAVTNLFSAELQTATDVLWFMAQPIASRFRKEKTI